MDLWLSLIIWIIGITIAIISGWIPLVGAIEAIGLLIFNIILSIFGMGIPSWVLGSIYTTLTLVNITALILEVGGALFTIGASLSLTPITLITAVVTGILAFIFNLMAIFDLINGIISIFTVATYAGITIPASLFGMGIIAKKEKDGIPRVCIDVRTNDGPKEVCIGS